MDANEHARAISDAALTAVETGRTTFEEISRLSGLTNRGVRKVARQQTVSPHADTLTRLQRALETLGIPIATKIVRMDVEGEDDQLSPEPSAHPHSAPVSRPG